MIPPLTWSARHWGEMPERHWPDRGWVAEWMTLDGDRWFARLAPEGEPGLPPVVMVHGLVVSGAYFRPVAKELDRRYRLYVPDLPGYGRSNSRRILTLPQLADRLATWMDVHGLGASVLVGNSMGCQVLTLLAIARPDLVAGLVLVAPTMDPAVQGPIRVMARGVLDIPRERQSLWTIWMPDLLRAGPRLALTMLGRSIADDQLARLPEVRPPALLVGGERDPIVPAAWVRDMAERMPQARALVLPGSPHAMNYSSPRDLARAIDTAVRGHMERMAP
jgi:pimeloyl-ACP methyl ester carboxylesterase